VRLASSTRSIEPSRDSPNLVSLEQEPPETFEYAPPVNVETHAFRVSGFGFQVRASCSENCKCLKVDADSLHLWVCHRATLSLCNEHPHMAMLDDLVERNAVDGSLVTWLLFHTHEYHARTHTHTSASLSWAHVFGCIHQSKAPTMHHSVVSE
jgi:hypothetical protein